MGSNVRQDPKPARTALMAVLSNLVNIPPWSHGFPAAQIGVEVLSDLVDKASREFIQTRIEGLPGEPTTGPGPLSKLLRAPHALELLLLVYAVTTGGDYGVTERSQLWGRAAGIYLRPDRNASVAVSRQWQHLEELGLIERKQHGRLKRIIKRRELGLVGKISLPYTAPTGARNDVYFRVPFAYWREGWHQKLEMPGKAVLLAAMSRRRKTFTLPQDTRGARALGLGRHTMARGIEELLRHKLLVKAGTDEVVNARTMRGYEWVLTYRLVKPFDINLSKSEIERLGAEQVALLTPGADVDVKAGQPE